MAKWSDILTLITLIPPDEPTNENGFNNPPTESTRAVFCNKKSTGYNEFYKAQASGYHTEIKFDVHTQEYDGEQLVEWNGRRYKVLHAYGTKNDEFTELTVSDLSELSENEAEPDDLEGGGDDGDI